MKDTPKNPKSPNKKAAKKAVKKRPPQIHTDEETRQMLEWLSGEHPGTSYKELVKHALKLMCDKVAYSPPIHLRRLEQEDLRTMAGYSAETVKVSKQIIKAIRLAKLEPAKEDALIEKLESAVINKLAEAGRIIMRQAAIPIHPELPKQVQLVIDALEREKLATKDKSTQMTLETSIGILQSYCPPTETKTP